MIANHAGAHFISFLNQEGDLEIEGNARQRVPTSHATDPLRRVPDIETDP
jgi:hypothetical protein